MTILEVYERLRQHVMHLIIICERFDLPEKARDEYANLLYKVEMEYREMQKLFENDQEEIR